MTELTPEQQKEIALGLFSGKIFTSQQLSSTEDIGYVFMPVLFLSAEARAELLERKVVVFWEWLHKAGPRSINGHPMFHSFSTLNVEDWNAIVEMAQRMAKAVEAL